MTSVSSVSVDLSNQLNSCPKPGGTCRAVFSIDAAIEVFSVNLVECDDWCVVQSGLCG